MAKQKGSEVVAGYLFECVGGSDYERNDTVCQIIERAGTDSEQMDEPRFMVEFGDGTRTMASSSELRPWFPT